MHIIDTTIITTKHSNIQHQKDNQFCRCDKPGYSDMSSHVTDTGRQTMTRTLA